MEQDTASTLSAADTLGAGSLPVRHFRQVLLWPLRLLPEAPDPTVLRRTAPPWQALHDAGEASPSFEDILVQVEDLGVHLKAPRELMELRRLVTECDGHVLRQRQGEAEAIEAGAEVGAGGRDAHGDGVRHAGRVTERPAVGTGSWPSLHRRL